MKYTYNKISADEITDFLKYESGGNFEMKITNYTISAKIEDDKYFFSNTPMSKSAFIFYNMMKKDVGGEIREEPKGVRFFDFSGIKKGDVFENCFCVDINSAYLQVLLNEKIITGETFKKINDRTKKNERLKMDRLKSVGMFASNPTLIKYTDGEAEEMASQKNPLSWVFYQACKTTTEIMQSVINEDFLFYWVDGIFIKGNPERIKNKIQKMGYPCKIEKIENLRIYEKNIIYSKDGKEKILFLPHEEKKVTVDFSKAIKK